MDMITSTCPLCKTDSAHSRFETFETIRHVDCPRCGQYRITMEAAEEIHALSEKDQSEVSSWIRYSELRGASMPTLVSASYSRKAEDQSVYKYKEILETYSPKTVADRLDRIMMNLSRLSAFQGAPLAIDVKHLYVFQACNQIQMGYLGRALVEKNWLRGISSIPASSAVITPEGWNHISSLEKGGGASKQAFVAMAFHERLRVAWEQGLKPGIDQAGFAPFRIDKTEHNQKICDLIIAEINKSTFLVADVTYHRQGVYFEAGYALGLGLPVIWCCRADHIRRCHFDTRQYNHILWKTPEELREKVKNRIEATIKRPRA